MNLEIKPYVVSSLTTDRAAASPFSNKRDSNGGFDFKYGLTRGLILDTTYRTDFARVEEDQQTRHSLRWPPDRGGIQRTDGAPSAVCRGAEHRAELGPASLRRLSAPVVSTRVIVTPNAKTALTSYIQYNGSSRTMSASLRWRWEYRPGSELFVIYSDGRNTLTGGYPDLLNRSVALKATRLLRF